jgi:hypothetical protein
MSNSGPSRSALYSLFLSSLALHVWGAICTHHQEHKLQRTAIGFVWFWCGIVLVQELVWDSFTLKHGQSVTDAAVVLLMIGSNSTRNM